MRAPELTELAIRWLQTAYPDAFITTELSVAEWGGASVDVAAITTSEIVGVEIKGEGDSPTRLELQGLKYGRVCRFMWLLPSPEGTLARRCESNRPRGWGMLAVEDGRVMPAALGERTDGTVRRSKAREQPHQCAMAMCETLWRDELVAAARIGEATIHAGPRPRVSELRAGIVASLPTPRIHDLMIDRLRKRVWPAGKRVIAPSIDPTTICAPCRGTGLWQGGTASQYGLPVQDVTCGHCRGTGKVVADAG